MRSQISLFYRQHLKQVKKKPLPKSAFFSLQSTKKFYSEGSP